MPQGDIELMADAVLVVLLLAFIWAAVLVPSAAGARASREAAFLSSLRVDGGGFGDGGGLDGPDRPRLQPALSTNARRRQVLGGLVVALGATLALGLLPTFRLLLVVHLLLLDSALVYVGLLVRVRDERMARTGTPVGRIRWHDSEVAEVEALAALADEPEYAEARGQRYARLAEDDYRREPVYEAYDDDGDLAYDDGDLAYDDGGRYYGDDSLEFDEEAEAALLDDELGLARPA